MRLIHITINKGCILAILLSASLAQGQDEFELTSAIKLKVIENAILQLQERYIFPERGEIAATELRQRLNSGYFDEISDPQTFANRIIGVMDVISDWHLWVNYYPDSIPDDYDYFESLEDESVHDRIRRRNFGIEKIERLPGNIGYIEFRSFSYLAEESEQALAHAMQLLAHTSGLIIDLRRNGGGSPDMVELVSSYFLESSHHIGTIAYREADRREEIFTRSQIQGPHYGSQRPLYILISEGTFSGAEALAYTLQVRNRAVLIGEKTIGGAHPTEQVRLHEHFMMGVPIARSIDAVTQSNWQYVGVRPDHDVAREEAREISHGLLLEELLDSNIDSEAKEEVRMVLRQMSD